MSKFKKYIIANFGVGGKVEKEIILNDESYFFLQSIFKAINKNAASDCSPEIHIKPVEEREQTQKIFLRGEIIGEMPGGKVKVHLLANECDGLFLITDKESIIPCDKVVNADSLIDKLVKKFTEEGASNDR